MRFFHKGPDEKAIRIAKAVAALEEAEGWAHFKSAAQDLIDAHMPDVSSFSQEQQTVIASQMTFISGIKRCLGLIEYHKDVLASVKTPEV